MTTATVDLERLAETTEWFRPMTVYGHSVTPEMQRKLLLRLAAAQKTRVQRNRKRRDNGVERLHWSNYCISFDQTGLTLYLSGLFVAQATIGKSDLRVTTHRYDLAYEAAKRLIQRWRDVLIRPCGHNLWLIPEDHEPLLREQHVDFERVEEITG
jgi:hypothetical protein